MMEVSYYPGCSLHGTAREYDESIRGVSALLGIGLKELEDWTCCGASSAHCTDERLAIDLAARNLAIAEKDPRELIVPCVACYSRFKAAEKEAHEHPDQLRFSYQGKVPIRYALDFFTSEPILEEVKKRRTKPLKGLKVVCYYGCLTVRPPRLTGIQRYEDPLHMDHLMEVLGAEPLQWSYKTDCCGASLVMTRTDIVRKLSGRLLAIAKEAEADAIVTGCPMCHANLDTRQEELAKETGERFEIPILYFSELMGLALGHKDAKRWLSHHLTDPLKRMGQKGLI
ncbi:MAG: CoB--CoM heterodisulfide reductase iron-sulfur subunit B family protein [Desulfobacterota bacterium]|nr:CoB--CoM heterodisulfide reductase iron-sulfur subunit B family protein [Thermodesulfobacteriota bacterium]